MRKTGKSKQAQTNVRTNRVPEPNPAPTLSAPLSSLTIQRALHRPSALMPTDVRALQRTLGNQSVARLLGRDRSTGDPRAAPGSAPSIQRASGPAGGEVDGQVAGRIQRAQNGGTTLPTTVRRTLEPRLGADLSGVKVHTDKNAIQLSRELGAKAFTHKQHIFYGEGQSPSDLQLTAHEAVHTIQQGAVSKSAGASSVDTKTPGIQRKFGKSSEPKQSKNFKQLDTTDVAETLPKNADKFTITLSAWQDDPNYLLKSVGFTIKKAFAGIFGKKVMSPTGTGHSWVELRAYDGEKVVLSDSYGFMKEGVKHPDPFHGDSGGKKLYKDYEISKDKFANVIATAQQIAEEKPKYELKGMNCTMFAKMLVNAAGLSFAGTRVVPGAKHGMGKHFTPVRLFQALKRDKKRKGGAYNLDKNRHDNDNRPDPNAPHVPTTLEEALDHTGLLHLQYRNFESAKDYLYPEFYDDLPEDLKIKLAQRVKTTREILEKKIQEMKENWYTR